MATDFRYEQAFNRTIGWITEAELSTLRASRVAVAGLGGVGGSHLLTLTRLGIGAFNLADPDHFELANLNRQAGARAETLGRPKVETLAEMARDINPELRLREFPEGVTEATIPAFLDGVDLFVDGLDFFTLGIRRSVFAACEARGIPAITAAPLGMGTAWLVFGPGAMAFERYFRFTEESEGENLLRFLVGLAPRALHGRGLVEPGAVDLANQRGPSTPMGCELAAGVTGTEALKLLLGRGRVPKAPRGQQFDGYRDRLVRTWRPGGNHHPLQQLTLAVARRRFGDTAAAGPASPPAREDTRAALPYPLDAIVDLARWSPSGDNTQPWCFAADGPETLTVHVRPGDHPDPYDYDQRGTWLALGALLESLRIAASRFGRGMSWELVETAGSAAAIRVTLAEDPEVVEDSLLSRLPRRSVRRGPYRLRPLSTEERQRLAASLPETVRIRWRQGWHKRRRWAAVNALATRIRLSIPETFATHRQVLDWQRRFSPGGVPAASVPVDPLTRRLMGWAMGDWSRVRFLNRFLAGTLLPRLEMDWVPGLACAAHFQLHAELPGEPHPRRCKLLETGMGLQRLWLTADRLGLALQPAFAPLAFAHYARHDVAFTESAAARRMAQELAQRLAGLSAPDAPETLVFAGRIGQPWRSAPAARSVRHPVANLRCPPTLREEEPQSR